MRKILENRGTAIGCQSERHDSRNRPWETFGDAVHAGHVGSSERRVVHLQGQVYFSRYRPISEVCLWLVDYIGADRPGKNGGSVTVD